LQLRAGLAAGPHPGGGTTTGLTFLDHTTLSGLTYYWYEVIAANPDGSSAPSPPLMVVAPLLAPLSASQAGPQMVLSWPVHSAGGRLHTATNPISPLVWRVVTKMPGNPGGSTMVTFPVTAGRAGYS
jgi:hypothetical protein